MSKTNAIIFGSLVLATLFGVYGQGMAYFLNESFIEIHSIYSLSVLTILSIILFLISFVLSYHQYKKRKIKKNRIVLNISVFIGLPVSCWSLFVLAMWWG